MDVPFEPVWHASLRDDRDWQVPAPSNASVFGTPNLSTEVAGIAGRGPHGV